MTEDLESVDSDEPSFISMRKVVIFVFAAMVVYLIILFCTEFDQVVAAIAGLDWWWVLPAMMGLSFMNYTLRYIKWQYFLRRIDVNLSHADSFGIFLAGFTLTISPGKIGEAVKGYFIKELDGTPIAKTVPVVVSERVTDLLALVLLAMVGFILGLSGVDHLTIVLLVGGLVVLGAIFLSHPKFYNVFLRRVSSFGPLKRFQDSIDMVEDTMVKTLKPTPMVLSTAISIPGWFMECIELWLVLSLLTGAGIPSLTPTSLTLLMVSTFIHSAASLIGAVSFLPGGLGSYEATCGILVGLLLGLPEDPAKVVAGAATIIIRLMTLWFSVFVGSVALGISTHRKKRESVQQA